MRRIESQSDHVAGSRENCAEEILGFSQKQRSSTTLQNLSCFTAIKIDGHPTIEQEKPAKADEQQMTGGEAGDANSTPH